MVSLWAEQADRVAAAVTAMAAMARPTAAVEEEGKVEALAEAEATVTAPTVVAAMN